MDYADWMLALAMLAGVILIIVVVSTSGTYANLRRCEEALTAWQKRCESNRQELAMVQVQRDAAQVQRNEMQVQRNALRAHIGTIDGWLHAKIAEARQSMNEAVNAKSWEVAGRCNVQLNTFERVRQQLTDDSDMVMEQDKESGGTA